MTKLNATYVYKQFMNSVKKAKEDVEERLVALLDRIGKDTTDKVKEYVNLYFYDSVMSSDSYNRLAGAGGFLDTITYEINVKDISVKIYCDWEKLNFSPDPGHLGHHIGFDGEHFTTGLYDYIMDGNWHSSKIVAKPRHYCNGIQPELAESINKWLGDYATKKVRDNLANAGYDVKIINQDLSTY